MQSVTVAKSAASMREKIFWALIATLALGQLVAFWMLCNYQVRQAQVRDATVQVERMAMAECLRYVPATPAHCVTRMAMKPPSSASAASLENTAHLSAAASTTMSRARPVSFNLR